MEAKELRIGNWVDFDQREAIIAAVGRNTVILYLGVLIDDYSQRSETTTQNLDKVNPIPLTEEWLRKLRFEEQNFETDLNREWYKTFELEKFPKSISLSFYVDKAEGFFTYDIGYGYIERKIEYVHQLQNLYFALTGEELYYAV